MEIYNMFILLFSLLAHAEDPDPFGGKDPFAEEPKVVYKQKTEIDFEALEIEGLLVKPQGTIILERRSAAFNPLIKLRTDFNYEMQMSVEEIN
jgi:hypothetical protein